MKITPYLSNEAILEELGRRIAGQRIELNMTQAEVAKKAGVAKRTLENIENGSSFQMGNMIRILRVLDLMDELNRLIPEQETKPMQLLRAKNNKVRMRASTRKRDTIKEQLKPWTWKEDE